MRPIIQPGTVLERVKTRSMDSDQLYLVATEERNFCCVSLCRQNGHGDLEIIAATCLPIAGVDEKAKEAAVSIVLRETEGLKP